MKIIAISDTHMQLEKVKIPEGDILIHAGDLTYNGTLREMTKELTKLEKFKNKVKDIVIICGNHDWLGEKEPGVMKMLCEERGITLLQHESAVIQGFKIFGSPYTPEFFSWAFNVPREDLAAKWEAIPEGTDIVISHGPPKGILDKTPSGEEVGCEALYKRLLKVKPYAHIFGHIHRGYGILTLNETKYVNASICDENYQITNLPWEIEL